jgi:RNA polymerase III transcription factor (TF)IIIC subunit HTH domain
MLTSGFPSPQKHKKKTKKNTQNTQNTNTQAGPWRSCWIRLGYDPTLPENSGHGHEESRAKNTPNTNNNNADGRICLRETRARNLQIVDVRYSGTDDERRSQEALAMANFQEFRASAIAKNTFSAPADPSSSLSSADVVAQAVPSPSDVSGWECDLENAILTQQCASGRAMNILQLCDMIAGSRADLGVLDVCAECQQQQQQQQRQQQAEKGPFHGARLDAKTGWLSEAEMSSLVAIAKSRVTGGANADAKKKKKQKEKRSLESSSSSAAASSDKGVQKRPRLLESDTADP